MNGPIDEATLIVLRDSNGEPTHVVIPLSEYIALRSQTERTDPTVPNTVVNNVFDNQVSPARAWREYLQFTQAEVAERMGVSQSAYAQLENKAKLRKSSRERIAAALGLQPAQLAF